MHGSEILYCQGEVEAEEETQVATIGDNGGDGPPSLTLPPERRVPALIVASLFLSPLLLVLAWSYDLRRRSIYTLSM